MNHKKYFDELGKILKKYDLCDKPHLIYNVDEKGINTGGGKPPHIVTSRNKIAQVVEHISYRVTERPTL
jgi:hypothetical protein